MAFANLRALTRSRAHTSSEVVVVKTVLTLVSQAKCISGDKSCKVTTDVNARLRECAREGLPSCVKTMLESGAAVDSIDDMQMNALYKAASEGHVNCSADGKNTPFVLLHTLDLVWPIWRHLRTL